MSHSLVSGKGNKVTLGLKEMEPLGQLLQQVIKGPCPESTNNRIYIDRTFVKALRK